MQKGQALIVIIFVLAVALTVGLAVVSRSVTDVGTSTTQEESSRALSAAEAGIEAALAAPMNQQYNSIGVVGIPYSGNSISIPEPLSAGESATIFMTGHDSDGNITEGVGEYSPGSLDLCWGTVSTGSKPAIEASLYYKIADVYKITRYAYDPDSRGGFTSADTNTGSCPSDRSYLYHKTDRSYLYHKTISGLPSGKILLRVRLLYNGDTAHYVAVSGSSSFPVQGKNITSEATDGSTTRKIEVFQRYPDLAPMLDSAVFSGAGLVK